jgi:putative transposase
VNRTSFYAWQTAEPTLVEEQDAQLAPQIRVIFKRHRRRYEARRIAEDLKQMGHPCDRSQVSKVMKTLRLRASQPAKVIKGRSAKVVRSKTSDSRHRLFYG